MRLETPKTPKSPLFNWRFLPMDIGRGVYMLMNLHFRPRKLDARGQRWRGPLEGGCIIAANHNSFHDPLVIGTAFWRRRVHMLAAESVMTGRLRTALLRGMGCIRIDRNISDLEGIRSAIGVVREGRCLCMFPEGHLSAEGDAQAVKGGAILIALQAGAPILPVYIHRRRHWFGRWTLVIGEPFDAAAACGRRFPSVSDIQRASDALQARMQACRNALEAGR